LTNRFGPERFDFPENHIEADNRLSWDLGQLDRRFGDEAFYIHLKRDRDKVARSYLKRFDRSRSIINHFCEGIRMTLPDSLIKKKKLLACYDLVDTINTNIEFFLTHKKNTLIVNVEDFNEDFKVFWDKIGAEGDLDKALGELDIKYNPSEEKNAAWWTKIKDPFTRRWRCLRSCIRQCK
jgi:hypothetical protein